MIRKTGCYMTESLLDRIQKEPAVIIELAQTLLKETNRANALKRSWASQDRKPVNFDAFVNPDDCTNIRTTAKELKIPERKFVKFLLKRRVSVPLSLRSASSLQQEEQRRTLHRPGFRDLPLYRLSDLLHPEGQERHPHPLLWNLRR
mgnify:CR=1 FL=1